MNDSVGTRKINFIEEVYEDGVLVQGRKVSQVSKEPHFVKLYLKDLAHLRNLPAWVSGVLYELLKKMDYSNEIVLNSTVKNRIAEELNIHPKTIDNALVKFVSKKILFRQGKGVFLANPFIFGRGNWGEVEEIRVKVSYRANGDKEVEAEIIDGVQLGREEAMAEERAMNASSGLEEALKADKEAVKFKEVKTIRSRKKKAEVKTNQELFEMSH